MNPSINTLEVSSGRMYFCDCGDVMARRGRPCVANDYRSLAVMARDQSKKQQGHESGPKENCCGRFHVSCICSPDVPHIFTRHRDARGSIVSKHHSFSAHGSGGAVKSSMGVSYVERV